MWEADVLLADGSSAHLRPVRPDDAPALERLYASLSDDSRYFRFFSAASPAVAARYGAGTRLDDDHFALVVEAGDAVVAVADYHRRVADVAEVAFTVRDDFHGRGLGTLLLEHLAEVAVANGVHRFVANVLRHNDAMRRVFADAGYATTWHAPDFDVVEVTLDLTETDEHLGAQAERARRSEALSIARLLHPSSIAVVGAGRRPDSVGNAILRNLIAGGFAGPLYAVNRNADVVCGLAAHPSLTAIGAPVDLAVIAVPAASVAAVVTEAATRGARGAVVISSGFAEAGDTDREAELVATARRHGMRLVGPNCFGIANTHPSVRMNATFAPFAPTRGVIGFASQSGGIGIELMARAREAGLGVSSFVSLGNKADVSTNDLLQYWDGDPDTDVVVLYVESFGNPRKFGRVARHLARRKPVVVVKGGRTIAGSRGAASHTAALAAPDVAVDELFRQAGVVRVDTLEEMFGVTRLLAHQPLPAGSRVAIVSNGGGPGILAADACDSAGLDVPVLSHGLQAELRACAPPGAGVSNPVDLVASAGADVFEAALRALLRSDEIDALIVLFVSPLVTRAADVRDAVTRAASATRTVPIAACFLGDAEPASPLPTGAGGSIPTYAFPESAAHALGHAARLAAWRRAPGGSVPSFPDLDLERARALVTRHLDAGAGGAWLGAPDAVQLLDAAGIPCLPVRRVRSADDAVDAARDLGYPVALKAGAPHLVHKTDVGGVVLAITDDAAVRAAVAGIRSRVGADADDVLVQPMTVAGTELIAGVTHDPSFGPLVLLGAGGITAELLHDVVLRLVPLTDVDAASMVRGLRSSPLLFGYRGAAPADTAAVEEILLRLGQLADAVPEIGELDCNPVIVTPDGAVVADAKIRLAPIVREGFGGH